MGIGATEAQRFRRPAAALVKRGRRRERTGSLPIEFVKGDDTRRHQLRVQGPKHRRGVLLE